MDVLMSDLGIRIPDLDSFVFDTEWTAIDFII
jgi:hypothetical protein